MAGEANTIRIGSSQTGAYIAGIRSNTTLTGGLPVVVNANGELGIAGTSSERFKTAIAPIGPGSAKLAQLRPVTFRLKSEPHGQLQYGLIAEEVAKVYPDLVVRNASGRIDGVRYDELAPLLLSELQRQQGKVATQDVRLSTQALQIRDLKLRQEQIQQQVAELQRATRRLRSLLVRSKPVITSPLNGKEANVTGASPD